MKTPYRQLARTTASWATRIGADYTLDPKHHEAHVHDSQQTITIRLTMSDRTHGTLAWTIADQYDNPVTTGDYTGLLFDGITGDNHIDILFRQLFDDHCAAAWSQRQPAYDQHQ